MIIRELTLHNFLIFRGDQTLKLKEGLYVIHGENGYGKSTFLNAISWCLLGSYRDRQGNRVPDSVLLNQQARKQGDTQVYVSLVIAHDGEDAFIRRSYDAATNKRTLYVKKGEQTLPQDDAERFLRSLLDEDVARFFLFDGEDLRRYEEMLAEGGEPEVRQAVEHILGLPALMNAKSDLAAVAGDFRKKATAAAKIEGKAQQAVLQAEQFEITLAHEKENLANLQAKRLEQVALREAAEEVLAKDKALKQLLDKRAAMEEDLAKSEQACDETSARRREALAGAWQDVVASVVVPAREVIEKGLETAEKRELNKAAVAALEEALEGGTCDQCGQPLHGDAAETIKQRISELKTAIEEADNGAFADKLTAINLMGVKDSGRLAAAITEDKAVSKISRQIVEQSQALDDLTIEADPGAETALRKASEQREKAVGDLALIDSKIVEAEKGVQIAADALKSAQDEVQKLSTSKESAALQARAKACDLLSDLFSQAIGEFRDERRVKVGEDASEIFKTLTTSQDWTGLRIDENYGLVALDSNGDPVPGRSAGQEQIVAFSLIGALNRNATRTAPVVMDTPLGRLDKGHRAKVLAYLSDMAPQVFLLVHSAEVSEDDLDAIRDQVTAEFAMRKESEFHTVIEEKHLV